MYDLCHAETSKYLRIGLDLQNYWPTYITESYDFSSYASEIELGALELYQEVVA